jgi:hypothetical protein
LFTVILFAVPAQTQAGLLLGAEELVQAGGIEIAVPGYSVPSFVLWDGDGLRDLLVGEGGGGVPGKVRVYRNVGTATAPVFVDHSFVQSEGADLTLAGFG